MSAPARAGRRPLTHAGGDVALRARTADGRALVEYLRPDGSATGHRARCHAHELRGIGWGIAAIKAAIAKLPIDGEPPAPDSPQPAAAARWLFAHHAAAHRQED